MRTETYKTHRTHFKINLKAFWILSIFLTVSLLGAWVFQMIALAQKSQLLFEHQKKLVSLSEESTLEETNVSWQGMPAVEQLAQNLDFEKIDKVHYIRASESTVLAR